MDVKEVLQFVDRLVFEQTGKHLDDVQRAIIEGSWQRQTYDEISKKPHLTKNYLGDVGADLWKLLSEVLGEDIKKTNFVSTIERIYIDSYNSNICQIDGTNNHLSYPQVLNQVTPQKNLKETDINPQFQSPIQDLTLAPKIINFYGRDSELKTLDNWILNQNTRLISVLGISGIGKTTLVKKFVDSHLQKFELIIWKSLKYPKYLPLLLNDFLQVCQQEAKEKIDEKLKQLFALLTEKKCLIILDDVQNIFISGEFAGQYQTEYQDYQNFLHMMTEIEHQSSLILISQEQCAEMECLDQDLYPIKCLELSGLDEVEILKGAGLKDEASWLKLINLYEGNPVYLKSIASLIKNIFDGHVADVLAENSLLITKDIQSIIKQLFDKLSPLEKQLVLELSKSDQPVTREDLITTLDWSSMDLINSLQSLQKRYLLNKIHNGTIQFNLSPIFQEYVRNFCQN